ncbi:MAG: S41 family peptidase [Ardenticatenaceae bacterium]|nr:S41 family peptidase [Ardenticatenaceae bacterium]
MNVRNLPPDASVYLDNVLEIMRKNAIYRNQVDWNVLRAQTYERAQDAQTSSDTYGAIQYALTQLGDHHSYFLPPDRVTKLRSATVIDNPSPKGEILENRVGYVLVPKFSSHDADQINNFATMLQEIIRGLDAQNLCGWIVDLRGNEGGNMWGMLAGIGSVLGEGRVGAFVYPDGQAQHWYYANGEARVETWMQAKVNGVP